MPILATRPTILKAVGLLVLPVATKRFDKAGAEIAGTVGALQMFRAFVPFLRNVAIHVLVVSFLVLSAAAQSDSARVWGEVVDPSGNRIKGARVELIDIGQNQRSTSHTNAVGFYTFSDVRPGHYRMRVSAPGFRTEDRIGLSLYTQQNSNENFKLAAGSVVQSVTG